MPAKRSGAKAGLRRRRTASSADRASGWIHLAIDASHEARTAEAARAFDAATESFYADLGKLWAAVHAQQGARSLDLPAAMKEQAHELLLRWIKIARGVDTDDAGGEFPALLTNILGAVCGVRPVPVHGGSLRRYEACIEAEAAADVDAKAWPLSVLTVNHLAVKICGGSNHRRNVENWRKLSDYHSRLAFERASRRFKDHIGRIKAKHDVRRRSAAEPPDPGDFFTWRYKGGQGTE